VKKSFIAAGLVLTMLAAVPAWSGKTSGGSINLSASYLSFGLQRAGSISSPQILTVTNNTPYQFACTSVNAETGFTVASTNCTVLNPGQSCSVQVVFVPLEVKNYVSHLNLATPYSPPAVTAVLYGTGSE
jgi:Abnormal spindle-like microcephaly-assoc'd, ASPM-SPD-2-Hydin